VASVACMRFFSAVRILEKATVRPPEGHTCPEPQVLGRDDVCGEKRQELGRPDGFLHLAGALGYPLPDKVQVEMPVMRQLVVSLV